VRETVVPNLHLSPFDAADHLQTAEEIAAYLDAALEEAGEDPGLFAHALGVVARAQNVSKLARDAGISRQGLVKALAEDGNPSLATIMKVTRALGIKLVTKPV
jgi:probable addiction module antidote protein